MDVRPPPRLLDRVRAELRTRHCSLRTEKAYVGWIRRFILFHGKRHPSEMGAEEITRFLSALAIERNVAASTQNQALSALLFLYKEVLAQELPWLDGIARPKTPARIPAVLTREEVRQVLAAMDGPPRLAALLLYGAGLRLLEALRLRVRTWTSSATRSSCAWARAPRTGSPCCRRPPAAIWPSTWRPSASSTWRIRAPARAGWSCPGRWAASTPPPAGSGSGNGSSRRPGRTSTSPAASAAGTTSTNPCCSAPCARRYAVRASSSTPPVTPSATRSPRTCWKMAPTSARCRNCWATATSRRP